MPISEYDILRLEVERTVRDGQRIGDIQSMSVRINAAYDLSDISEHQRDDLTEALTQKKQFANA